MPTLTPDQIEAIQCADAHAMNNSLPSYTALRAALLDLAEAVLKSSDVDQEGPLSARAHRAKVLAHEAT